MSTNSKQDKFELTHFKDIKPHRYHILLKLFEFILTEKHLAILYETVKEMGISDKLIQELEKAGAYVIGNVYYDNESGSFSDLDASDYYLCKCPITQRIMSRQEWDKHIVTALYNFDYDKITEDYMILTEFKKACDNILTDLNQVDSSSIIDEFAQLPILKDPFEQ